MIHTNETSDLSGSLNGRHALFIAAAITVALAAMPGIVRASDVFVGNLDTIENSIPAARVRMVRQNATGPRIAHVEDAIFQGDAIRTDEGAKARIRLSDGSVINIGPGAEIEFTKYSVDIAQAKRLANIRVANGTVRFTMEKTVKARGTYADIAWKDSKVLIETGLGTASLKGTDVIVSVSPKEADIAVLDGAVGLKSNVNGEVLISASQASSLMSGVKPAMPVALAPETRRQLIAMTTPPVMAQVNTSPGQGPSYLSADVARDVAAGVSLLDIMRKAERSGMKVSDVVASLVTAGVTPSLVVYTAIQEGYSAQQVVAAAIKAGAPLDAVTNAAIGAGADKRSIYLGAAEAGAPSEAVANAVTNATAPTSQTMGYTPPAEGGPSVYTPSTPIVVSGGGGATPSTQPASPYRPKQK